MKDSKKEPQIIILFGRSGCGKGTQAKFLIQDFGLENIETGKILRKQSVKDSFSGRKLKKILIAGNRVPTHFVFQIWGNEIEKVKNKANFKGLVIDGSPRSVLEAELIDGFFAWYEWKNIKPILLDISEEEAFARLTKRRICQKCGRLIPWVGDFKKLTRCDKCGGKLERRPDDKPEIIKNRLEYYKKDVEPVIDYYREKGILISIDGEQSIEGVYQDIKKNLQR